MKLCKDCRHVIGGTENNALCRAYVLAEKVSVVTGQPYKVFQFCSFVRKDESKCGTEAKWFMGREQGDSS